MTLANLAPTPQRRLNPSQGLVVDVAVWNASHEYHRAQQRLHNLAMHGAGVVTGLEVTAAEPPGRWVVVHPGLAVDDAGYPIGVGAPLRFEIPTDAPGTMYLILQYRELPENPVRLLGDEGVRPLYMLEAYRLEQITQLPAEPHIELARIQLTGGGGPVTNALDLRTPGINEIDLRFRRQCASGVTARAGIGLVALSGEADAAAIHLPGVMNLIQLINAATGICRAEFCGVVDLNSDLSRCDVLVMAGHGSFTLSEGQRQGLAAFLDRGGVLLGEACGANLGDLNAASPFRQSFRDLAQQLGRTLTPAGRGHPMFTSLHPFAGPPEGIAGPAVVVADDAVVYSDGDYGCLWDGGWTGHPASRETIRASVELGANLAVYSSRRRQVHSLQTASRIAASS
ncbi:MAG: DUF4159 domain-containing protein [SAR202 cluster bacterium]|nr:DUF4159 domain-containing protein [SAR202 cluster bacterium]